MHARHISPSGCRRYRQCIQKMENHSHNKSPSKLAFPQLSRASVQQSRMIPRHRGKKKPCSPTFSSNTAGHWWPCLNSERQHAERQAGTSLQEPATPTDWGFNSSLQGCKNLLLPFWDYACCSRFPINQMRRKAGGFSHIRQCCYDGDVEVLTSQCSQRRRFIGCQQRIYTVTVTWRWRAKKSVHYWKLYMHHMGKSCKNIGVNSLYKHLQTVH